MNKLKLIINNKTKEESFFFDKNREKIFDIIDLYFLWRMMLLSRWFKLTFFFFYGSSLIKIRLRAIRNTQHMEFYYGT